MQKQWWFRFRGNRECTACTDEMQALVRTEQLNKSTLCWSEGMTQWEPIESIPGLLAGGTKQPSQTPPAPLFPEMSLLERSVVESISFEPPLVIRTGVLPEAALTAEKATAHKMSPGEAADGE